MTRPVSIKFYSPCYYVTFGLLLCFSLVYFRVNLPQMLLLRWRRNVSLSALGLKTVESPLTAIKQQYKCADVWQRVSIWWAASLCTQAYTIQFPHTSPHMNMRVWGCGVVGGEWLKKREWNSSSLTPSLISHSILLRAPWCHEHMYHTCKHTHTHTHSYTIKVLW